VPGSYGSRLATTDLLPDWPGLSFIYLRIPWSYIEPREGEFNWSVVDTPMQRFVPRGLKACFRFSCSESWMEYATPEWVKEAGARGYRFTPGRGVSPDGPYWEPDFDDPVFLEKLNAFLAAAAARYDGHPDVAFIDVGSFGVWGEGHTWASTGKAYPNSTVIRHIDLHLEHFRRTRIVGMDDFLSRPHPYEELTAGVNRRAFDFQVPLDLRGKTLAVTGGLWVPGRQENLGRLVPVAGGEDRRVFLGELRVGEDGRIDYRPEWPELPDRIATDSGAEFAMACPELRHDHAHQPHSLKVPIEVLLAQDPPPGTRPFVHLLDPDTGEQDLNLHLEQEDPELTEYMASRGLGLRDDSILVGGRGAAYFHAEMAQQFWRRAPVIIESEHYGGSVARGNWGDGSGFLQAIQDYHADYASIHWWPHEFLRENRELVRRINRVIGYRLRLQSLSWPGSVGRDDEFTVQWVWSNAGVAPPYRHYVPTVTLKDADGGVAAVLVDDGLDMRDLPVDLHEPQTVTRTRSFRLPFQLRTGLHEVFVSVGDPLGRPQVALPLDGDDGSLRYRVGACQVRGEYAVSILEAADREQGELELVLEWQVHSDLGPGTIPFFHLDRGGGIAWAGGIPGAQDEVDRFAEQGDVKTRVHIPVPDLGPGEEAVLLTGLWRPDRIGQQNERCDPDHGEPDRRVRLGRFRVDPDRGVVFTRE
jgi:hypothetical protein